MKTRYERVIEILDTAIGGSNNNIGVHGAFWRGLTRDEFIATKVFNLDLVVPGNGLGSNLVKALKGESPFGRDLPNPPTGAKFSRMPADLPAVSDGDIAFIANWIDDGCPGAELPVLQWRPTNAPLASSRTDDVWFHNPNVGWAVNSNGQIISTIDGGTMWVEQLHDAEVYFRCLGFSSTQRGWAGALSPPGKLLFETSDGGKTWTVVTNLPELAPLHICGLSVVSDSVVYASGTNSPTTPPRMIKTVDGGKTWTAWDMRPWADILIDTYFTSPEHGWVVGGKANHTTTQYEDIRPVVLRTTDGGKTWENRVADIVDFPLGEWGWKIQFLSDQIGFISLENLSAGAILKTTDGGMSWKRLAINDPQRNANIEGIGFVDTDHGWIGGWGDAQFFRQSSSETFDGGLSWRDANEIGKGINRFRFFGNPVSVGYASGKTVYKYSNEPVFAQLTDALYHPDYLFDNQEPLPVSDHASMTISVPKGTKRFTVRIWDRFGAHVRTLLDVAGPSHGKQLISWDRTDDAGSLLAPGCFIWRATVDERSESRLVVIK